MANKIIDFEKRQKAQYSIGEVYKRILTVDPTVEIMLADGQTRRLELTIQAAAKIYSETGINIHAQGMVPPQALTDPGEDMSFKTLKVFLAAMLMTRDPVQEGDLDRLICLKHIHYYVFKITEAIAPAIPDMAQIQRIVTSVQDEGADPLAETTTSSSSGHSADSY